jgi:glycosyltransferase involved in cell wall biosynthesis
MKLLIIQPWFGAIGHPAQSLVNTARAIGNDSRVNYLVSKNKDSELCSNSLEQLKQWGYVHCFSVTSYAGRENTARAFLKLLRLRINGHRYARIFFFDSTLPVIALFWPVFARLCSIEVIHILSLWGPESMDGNRWFSRLLVRRLLRRADVRLYARTEELASAWTAIYRNISANIIGTLPSLEIPDSAMSAYSKPLKKGDLMFGIIGQIRPGKGLEWLVPIFQRYPDIGKLTVAGKYANQESHAELSFLDGFDGFVNQFMSEDEMLERSTKQDYLLMLYDESWDRRMESAILYVAARACRPVVVYSDSWSGRMVREFGCGVVAPNDRSEAIDFFRQIPRPGTIGYDDLIDGMIAFRKAHSVLSLRPILMTKLFN